jgi:hypothetical protein
MAASATIANEAAITIRPAGFAMRELAIRRQNLLANGDPCVASP